MMPHFELFVSWLRVLFRFRNKTLRNAVQMLKKNPVKGIDASACEELIAGQEISEEKIFLLEPEDFVELFLDMMSER
mgnify:FL=1